MDNWKYYVLIRRKEYMYQYLPIRDIYAREILDSCGNSTVEVEVLAGEAWIGRAAVPSGTAGNRHMAEAAVRHVNEQVAAEVIGMDVFDQTGLDKVLAELDGNSGKKKTGENTLFGVSLAAARSAAAAAGIPLYAYLGDAGEKKMPVPMISLFSGGACGENDLDLREVMMVPSGIGCFREALGTGAEIYHALYEELRRKGLKTSVSCVGGFTADTGGIYRLLELLMTVSERAGYRPGKEVFFALDMAAPWLYRRGERYVFPGESRRTGRKTERSRDEMIRWYEEMVEAYPICSLEDPMGENDLAGWKSLTDALGSRIQLVGDELFAADAIRIRKGIREKIGNAVRIRPGQTGTLTEMIRVIETAHRAGYQTVLSHCAGETEDTAIADLAVAFHVGWIRTGAPCRSERVAKYNQLLRIGERIETK